MNPRRNWAQAFAKQAKADHEAYRVLEQTDPPLPRSQALHFLQMACEKLCKAHLCRSGTEPDITARTHARIAKILPTVFKSQYASLRAEGPRSGSNLMKRVAHLAREIELLSPAVDDDGARPDNCEYPWEGRTAEKDGSRTLHVPADHPFSNLSFLEEHVGVMLLKMIPVAIDDLLANHEPPAS